MRFLQYPSKGRPPALTQELEELLVLTFGAIESVNVERWALEFGAQELPALPGTLRVSAYETDVVAAVHRLGQRYWERRGEASMWERPFPTGAQGRPPAVDLALFDSGSGTETRLEFGEYSVSKLRKDATKLADLREDRLAEFPSVESFVVLWNERADKMTGLARRRLTKQMADAAGKIEAPSV